MPFMTFPTTVFVFPFVSPHGSLSCMDEQSDIWKLSSGVPGEWGPSARSLLPGQAEAAVMNASCLRAEAVGRRCPRSLPAPPPQIHKPGYYRIQMNTDQSLGRYGRTEAK
ncbi:unnamed protein product [Arctogadus glacialis]